MILLYIENKSLLTKFITYFDNENIEYTTNIKDDYKVAVIAEINSKTLKLFKTKKVIFITYLEEKNIYDKFLNNLKYQERLIKILNNCYKVVVSIDYFKNLLSKYIKTRIYILYQDNPIINYKKKFNFKKKKCICVNDFDYENLDLMLELSSRFDFKFYYIGYKRMNKKEYSLYSKLLDNVIKIKYYDYFIYQKILDDCFLVIDLNSYNDINYIKIPILMKKKMLIKDSEYYQKYLISSKHVYYFNDIKSLNKKIKKITENRLLDLTLDAYSKIEDDDKKISTKCKVIFK